MAVSQFGLDWRGGGGQVPPAPEWAWMDGFSMLEMSWINFQAKIKIYLTRVHTWSLDTSLTVGRVFCCGWGLSWAWWRASMWSHCLREEGENCWNPVFFQKSCEFRKYRVDLFDLLFFFEFVLNLVNCGMFLFSSLFFSPSNRWIHPWKILPKPPGRGAERVRLLYGWRRRRRFRMAGKGKRF